MLKIFVMPLSYIAKNGIVFYVNYVNNVFNICLLLCVKGENKKLFKWVLTNLSLVG